jgi:hypothetical protein
MCCKRTPFCDTLIILSELNNISINLELNISINLELNTFLLINQYTVNEIFD